MGKQHFHISQSISGALAMSPADFADAFEGVFVDDDGEVLSVEEAHRILEEELAAGHRLIASCGCDNFDPIKGCLGHPVS
jgi:hypothetical protein